MHGKMSMAKRGVAALALLVLGACSAQVRNHGYLPAETDLQQIVPGVDTRDSVEDLVGVPTSSGLLNNSGYYYIESEMRHFAWKRPEVVGRQIVAITFDEAGVVTNIVTYGLEDGNVVPLTKRVTETSDGDITFIRKLFGNIGGLNAGQLLGN